MRASLDELAADQATASALLAHALNSAHDLGSSADGHGASAAHAGAAYAILFADAAALTADAELTEPARNAIRAVANHLADLIRHSQAHGGFREDIDPEAAAWLVLSIISGHRMRTAAMPDCLEPAVIALVLRALTP